jgi:hypothetical protein
LITAFEVVAPLLLCFAIFFRECVGDIGDYDIFCPIEAVINTDNGIFFISYHSETSPLASSQRAESDSNDQRFLFSDGVGFPMSFLQF